MSSAIAVLIPVLHRPQRVAPLVENLYACSAAIDCHPVFIPSEDDGEEIDAIAATPGAFSVTLPGELQPGDYARKINYGVEHTTTDFVFFGADDLYFHPGWAERAIAAWYESGACVIGTNDLANPSVQAGVHATHSLVHRDYAECGTIDDSSILLHEGYSHQYVDNEFVETAHARGTYFHAHDSHVEHSHPTWHTAEMDATYERGQRDHQSDSLLFQKRRELWS